MCCIVKNKSFAMLHRKLWKFAGNFHTEEWKGVGKWKPHQQWLCKISSARPMVMLLTCWGYLSCIDRQVKLVIWKPPMLSLCMPRSHHYQPDQLQCKMLMGIPADAVGGDDPVHHRKEGHSVEPDGYDQAAADPGSLLFWIWRGFHWKKVHPGFIFVHFYGNDNTQFPGILS